MLSLLLGKLKGPDRNDAEVLIQNQLVDTEFHSNPHVRSYHTRMELTSNPPEMNRLDMGVVGQTIKQITGVEDVTVYRYRVRVEKGRQHNWKTIEPSITQFLEERQKSVDEFMEAIDTL